MDPTVEAYGCIKPIFCYLGQYIQYCGQLSRLQPTDSVAGAYDS